MKEKWTIGSIVFNPFRRSLPPLQVTKPEPKACPCLHIEPCDPYCTCRNPYSSRGCARCCSYGSPEQQRAAAERLTATAGALKEVFDAARAYCDQLSSFNNPMHPEVHKRRLRLARAVSNSYKSRS
jgi:hypothetical protein